ncbi:MAG: PKD domain-containing protein, partial [Bacteroidota bacterium]|nr:PKD domain-containing protein [Bacteroidota bacterium]
MSKNYPFIRLSIVITCIIYFANITSTFSQDYSEINWYIGQGGKAVQFNKNDFEANVANGQHTPLGTGGSAMAVDPLTGNILFYTNGVNIYDASGQAMAPGGLVLQGNPAANQPAAISPVPGVEDHYFVFVNTGNGITATLINMDEYGNATAPQPPLGSVIPPSIQPLFNQPINAAMIYIPGSSPDENYIIVQGTDGVYHVFTIDGLTVQAPQSFAFPQGTDITAANFSYNEATGQIAVSPGGPTQEVQILTFDPATGALAYKETLAGTATAGGVYDTEWSEDGTKLYISSLGAGGGSGNVFQYDFDGQPPLSAALLPQDVYASYGLKKGPDNKIYHLYQAVQNGPYLMGVINAPDSVPGLVEYVAEVFPGNNFEGKQFPEITPGDQDDCIAAIDAPTTACQNQPVSFLPVIDPDAQSFSWDFGDGNTSTQQSPNYIFEQEGSFEVTLQVECGGNTVTATHQITITQNELEASLQDSTVCSFPPNIQLEPEVQGGDGKTLMYTWSNGDGTASVDPKSPPISKPGFYWVVVSDGNCEVYAGANVKLYREENRISNTWYFGNGGGLDFNGPNGDGPTEAIPPGPENSLDAPEGVAIISDPNGDVLFYTDGETVWNKTGAVMANGTNIGGSRNATQSSIIIPFPDDETLFYLFTPSELYGDGNFYLNYSIIDIKEENGLGAVIQKGVPLFSKSTERITAIEGGPGYLLLAHDFGNNTFRVYPIGPEGIGAPVFSSIGSVHTTSSSASGEGYMKFSSGGERIAVALPGPPNVVELFDFVDSTMKVTNYKRLELAAGETPYGIEFSPSGDMLYVSVNNNGSGPSVLYQFDLVDDDGEPIEQPVKVEVAREAGDVFGAIQIGSDGQLYMAVKDKPYIYMINGADNDHTINPVTLIEYDLLGGISSLGLPNFIQSLMQPPGDPSHSVVQGCVGEVTQFIGVPGFPDIDKASWVVTNRATGQTVHSSSEFETEFVFITAGIYDVVFTVSNVCEPNYYQTGQYFAAGDIMIPPIELNIIAPPDPPTLPYDAALCGATVTLTAGPDSPDLVYQWLNATTGVPITGNTPPNSIVVSEPGTYSVIISHASSPESCTSEGETIVWRPLADLDLGEDLVYCQGDVAQRLNTFIGFGTHAWTINNVSTTSTDQFQDIDTTVPGSFVYKVTITDDDFGGECVYTDEITVIVNPEPNYSLVVQENEQCTTAAGIITISQPQGDYSYHLISIDGVDKGITSPYENLESGVYNLTVTDKETGCVKSESIPISDKTDVIANNIGHEHGCLNEGFLQFEIIGATIPFEYRLHNFNTNTIERNWASSGSSIVTIENLPSSSRYELEIRQADNCINLFGFYSIINRLNDIPISVPRIINACVPEGSNHNFSVNNADPSLYNYTWTNEDGSSTGITSTLQESVAVNTSGFYKVTATSKQANPTICPSSAVVQVVLNDMPNVFIEPTGDACEGTLLLRAEPSGNYMYNWSHLPAGTSHPQTVSINQSMTVSVSVRSNASGCIQGSEPFDAIVESTPLSITLSASTACIGSEFMLTPADVSNQGGVTYVFFNPSGEELGTTIDAPLPVGPEHPEGTYRVEASRNGCTAEAEVNVTKLPSEEWEFLPESATICTADENAELNSIVLHPGGNFQD